MTMTLFARLSIIALCAATVAAFSTVSPSRISRTSPNNAIFMSHDETGQCNMEHRVYQQSKVQRIQQIGSQVWERMDTMKAAGLADDGMVPMNAGFKTNVGLLVGAFLFKWYRARFITKIPVWDRQPQWNMVVTSPEQEKELHAYQCKNCGSTIFIARHREWFFKGGNSECTNCGATGKDNFVDIRDDVIDEIDDDYFDYPSPLDYVSAAEKRRLVKEAGGDENLAKKIAIEKALQEDPKQIQVEPSTSSASSEGTTEKKKKKKKESSAETTEDSPKKVVPEKPSDDILDELDMDF